MSLPFRCSAATVLLLLLAIGLLALGCGPAASPGQDAGPTNAPTPAPTATQSPTATPVTTPTQWAPTEPMTPAPTAHWIPDMDGAIWFRLERQKAALESGDALPPETVLVDIETIYVEEVTAFLKSQGITPLQTINGRPVSDIVTITGIVAEIPESLLPELARQRVGSIWTANPYGRVIQSQTFGVLAKYQAGVYTPDTHILYSPDAYIWVSVSVPEKEFYGTKSWLESQGAVFDILDEDIADDLERGDTYQGRYSASVFMKLPVLEQLVLRPEVSEVTLGGFPVSPKVVEKARKWRSGGVPEPTPSSAGAGGVSSIVQPSGPAAIAHGAKEWLDVGITGAGVKIGIIDAGFKGWDTAKGDKRLPEASGSKCWSYVKIYCDFWGLPDHGAAVAEALHSIAPGAELYIALPAEKGQFKDAVNWLTGEGVDIILMARAWDYDGPGDGTAGSSYPSDSAIKTVQDAVDGGILWVNSAGNETRRTWFSQRPAGGYGKTTIPKYAEYYVNFDKVSSSITPNPTPTSPKSAPPADCNRVTLSNRMFYYFNLRWSDRWPKANINLDLHLEHVDPKKLYTSLVSAKSQDGGSGQHPLESIMVNTFSELASLRMPGEYAPPGDYCIKVIHDVPSGARNPVQPAWIQLQAFPKLPNLHYSTASHSIVSPAELEHPALLSVGAAQVNADNPASLPNVIAGYSSRGPLPGSSVIKPDIVGVDNVRSTVMSRNFSGTSQSAPHIAGLAALVMEAFPGKTAAEVAKFLTDTAVDRGSAGDDYIWGHGLAKLPQCFQEMEITGHETNINGWLAECPSERHVGNNVRYFTFTLDRAATGMTIDFSGASAPSLYLLEGKGADGPVAAHNSSFVSNVRIDLGSSSSNVDANIVSNGILPPGTYTIEASTSASASSGGLGLLVSLPVPARPSNLWGESLTGSNKIVLDWPDAANAAEYEVQQWDAISVREGGKRGKWWRPLPFKELGRLSDYTIEFRESSAVIGNLVNGVSYSHRVRSWNGPLNSQWVRASTEVGRMPGPFKRDVPVEPPTPTPPPPAR